MLKCQTNLFNDIRTKLLDRKGTDIAKELADDTVAEAVIVQIQNVLDDLVVISAYIAGGKKLSART